MYLKGMVVPAFVLCLVLTANALTTSAPPKEEKTTPPWELARAKVEAAKQTCLALAQEYLEGKATVEQVHQWSRRWMDAEREASSKKPDQLEAIKAHVNRMQQLEKAAQERLQKRKGPASDVPAATYHRLEAELAVSRSKTSR
jgi:hypothetical protein